ncbi:unnamed protein product, partial [Mesorhabditis spiculigera]
MRSRGLTGILLFAFIAVAVSRFHQTRRCKGDEFWSVRGGCRQCEPCKEGFYELHPCTSLSNRICEDCGVVDMDVPDFRIKCPLADEKFYRAVEDKLRDQYKKTFALKHVTDEDALDSEVDDELLEIIPERVQKPQPKVEFVESEDDVSDDVDDELFDDEVFQEAVKIGEGARPSKNEGSVKLINVRRRIPTYRLLHDEFERESEKLKVAEIKPVVVDETDDGTEDDYVSDEDGYDSKEEDDEKKFPVYLDIDPERDAQIASLRQKYPKLQFVDLEDFEDKMNAPFEDLLPKDWKEKNAEGEGEEMRLIVGRVEIIREIDSGSDESDEVMEEVKRVFQKARLEKEEMEIEKEMTQRHVFRAIIWCLMLLFTFIAIYKTVRVCAIMFRVSFGSRNLPHCASLRIYASSE